MFIYNNNNLEKKTNIWKITNVFRNYNSFEKISPLICWKITFDWVICFSIVFVGFSFWMVKFSPSFVESWVFFIEIRFHFLKKSWCKAFSVVIVLCSNCRHALAAGTKYYIWYWIFICFSGVLCCEIVLSN